MNCNVLLTQNTLVKLYLEHKDPQLAVDPEAQITPLYAKQPSVRVHSSQTSGGGLSDRAPTPIKALVVRCHQPYNYRLPEAHGPHRFNTSRAEVPNAKLRYKWVL